MRKNFILAAFSLILIFFSANSALANDWTFTDNFGLYNPGDLNEQGGWAVTNYYGHSNDTVNVSATDPGEGTKYVEITNHNSEIVTHDITPVNAGIFQFQMRQNKSGLFYFYALTSDQGGQLLFSIQFTESRGILLEEADKQITLLPDYNANQWYLFTIDFDNSRGERGTFKIKIDDGDYSEYPYVNSESAIFDFAQMVFGSDSTNETAISAFSDIQSLPLSPTTIDIIDSGSIPDTLSTTTTDTATSTPTPEPVIQENGDGSTTIIAI